MIDTLKKNDWATQPIEVARGERFAFGENWKRFLNTLDIACISEAEKSLKHMLEVEELVGKRFLDIGCGSGLFSLVARRLGAHVHSFDYDPQSVACAIEVKERFYPGDDCWTIEHGSALDADYLKSLGKFDVVYSWGVLHHTGNMWQALEYAQLPIASNGKLLIAIYNDTGSQSARWKWIKRTYNRMPNLLRTPFTLIVIAPSEAKALLRSVWNLNLKEYTGSWLDYRQNRGMNHWRDIVDWVGGYPYEVAKPEEIFDFYRQRGFTLMKLKCGDVGLGCNEFLFVREDR